MHTKKRIGRKAKEREFLGCNCSQSNDPMRDVVPCATPGHRRALVRFDARCLYQYLMYEAEDRKPSSAACRNFRSIRRASQETAVGQRACGIVALD